jgi:uncharacterized protein YecA (UPF0149 family)
MKVPGILARLEYLDGTFPRRALEQAIVVKEAITPELLDILEYAIERVDDIAYDERYMGHLYAMYLLAQFQETRAYPLIVQFFSIPGEVTLDVTGDLVTEALHRILASVSGGDTSLIESLIVDRDANEFVRNAAMRALLVPVARGERAREEVMPTYQDLFRGGMEREPSVTWCGLVSCCCDLYPEEVLEDIEQAYAEGLVGEMYIDYEWVIETMARGKEEVLAELRTDATYNIIDDTIREMEWWACFDQTEKPKWKRKVGRNEPCPCGSGQKYKKCCGARR